MIHEDARKFEALTEANPLRVTLRRSLTRELRRWLLWILAVSAVFGITTSAVMGWDWGEALTLIGILLVVGGAGGFIAVGILARSIARTAARPLELLIALPGVAETTGADCLNLSSGRALSPAELEADLAILHRGVRRMMRQSAVTIVELEQAREAANQQNIAKSHFLAKMSHELRTPLNAILGYTMLLIEDLADAGHNAAVVDLERIQAAGRNLLALINDILDLSKLESGRASLDRGVIDIAELIESVVAGFPAERRNGNMVKIEVANDIGIMVGDAGKIRQCLRNLIGNAFKFTSAGCIDLKVDAVPGASGTAVRFRIRDDGIGIATRDLSILFDAFSQIDTGPARKTGGTGLGLAITRRLARMMGGECTVESIEGEGSEFTLFVPLSPPATSPGEPGIVPNVVQAPRRRRERSALIIDDDAAAVDLMERWMQRMGYDVFATTDGEVGLVLAHEHNPDLILLDALMPGRSGYDLLVEMRRDPTLADTPVILITVDDDRMRGLDAGASEYLQKPVTEQQLRDITQVYRGDVSGEILVIDDDDDAAELIRRTVEQAGFSTRRARDGIEGLALAAEARPAAIVLDLAMPGLDGFGVIDRIDNDADLATVPLIVLSGRELTLSQHRALVDSGYRFFAKGSSTPREIVQSLLEMVA